jgi:GH43 family beta-xylosidase
MKIFCNSQGTQSRDPNVIKHNGKYYWTYAYEDRIYIMEAESVDGFAHGEGTLVWTPDKEEYAYQVWAPELHVLDGVCYIYVACDDGDNNNHRMYVLSNGCNDPLTAYKNLGIITDPTNKWAIDGTILHHATGRYIIWSGWEGDENVEQNIYIAKLKSPCEIEGERVMISRPEYDWEKLGGTGTPDGSPYINEGPFVFNEQGRTFVAYSGAGSWCEDYCVAILELCGENPMDASAWKKWEKPVLSKNDNFIGMGHASFIEEDRTIFFHAWRADEKNIVWNTVYPIVAKYRLEGDEFIFE